MLCVFVRIGCKIDQTLLVANSLVLRCYKRAVLHKCGFTLCYLHFGKSRHSQNGKTGLLLYPELGITLLKKSPNWSTVMMKLTSCVASELIQMHVGHFLIPHLLLIFDSTPVCIHKTHSQIHSLHIFISLFHTYTQLNLISQHSILQQLFFSLKSSVCQGFSY